MATTATQQAPKAAKQTTLVFHHKNYFHIKQLAAESCKEFQELIDALAPEMKAALPESFETANLEALFRKVRVELLPNHEAFTAAGIDLTQQVKLQPAELALMEEVRNPSFSLGDTSFRPKGNFRYKDGKICLESTQQMLEYHTLTLEGLALETYNSLTKLYKSLVPHRENEVDRMSLRQKSSWFIAPEMLQDSTDWTIEGQQCVINPKSLQYHLGILGQF